MKTAWIFLATGFEETEAVTTIDLLRRAEIGVTVISVAGDCLVVGANGITVQADCLIESLPDTPADAVILPGGLPGATNLNGSTLLREIIRQAHEAGRLCAAICAAPLVFGSLGMSSGRRMTCYPGFESQLPGAVYTADPVTVDGHIITGKGPALVMEFSLAVIRYLSGSDKAREIAGGLLLPR